MYQFYKRRPVGGRTQHEIDSTPRNRASRICYPRMQQRREGGRQRQEADGNNCDVKIWRRRRRARGHAPSANKTIEVFFGNGLIPEAARSLFKFRSKTAGLSLRRYLVPFFAVFMPPSGRATASALLKNVAQLSALSPTVRGRLFLMLDARRRSARVECKTVL